MIFIGFFKPTRYFLHNQGDLDEVVGGGEGVENLNGLGEGDVADSEGSGQVVHHPAPTHKQTNKHCTLYTVYSIRPELAKHK